MFSRVSRMTQCSKNAALKLQDVQLFKNASLDIEAFFFHSTSHRLVFKCKTHSVWTRSVTRPILGGLEPPLMSAQPPSKFAINLVICTLYTYSWLPQSPLKLMWKWRQALAPPCILVCIIQCVLRSAGARHQRQKQRTTCVCIYWQIAMISASSCLS